MFSCLPTLVETSDWGCFQFLLFRPSRLCLFLSHLSFLTMGEVQHVSMCQFYVLILCMSTNAPCCWLAGIVLCGAVGTTLFVFHLQSQDCEGTPNFLFSPETKQTDSGQWGDIRWIWQKVFWIRIAYCTFKNTELNTVRSRERTCLELSGLWILAVLPLHLASPEKSL